MQAMAASVAPTTVAVRAPDVSAAVVQRTQDVLTGVPLRAVVGAHCHAFSVSTTGDVPLKKSVAGSFVSPFAEPTRQQLFFGSKQRHHQLQSRGAPRTEGSSISESSVKCHGRNGSFHILDHDSTVDEENDREGKKEIVFNNTGRREMISTAVVATVSMFMPSLLAADGLHSHAIAIAADMPADVAEAASGATEDPDAKKASLAKSPPVVGGLVLFSNDTLKYSLMVPEIWTRGEGQATGQRRVVAFYPEDDTETNVNVIVTNVGPDFTGLGSYGTPEMFGETLVGSLDRRASRREVGQKARLLNAKNKDQAYYVEYTIERPGEFKRHFLSTIRMGFDGIYNRLFTVTAQFREDDVATYRDELEQVVTSLKLNF